MPTMGSANVPQDGLAFTVRKVSDFCYLVLVYESVTELSFGVFTLYSLIPSHTAEHLLIRKTQPHYLHGCRGGPRISTGRVLATTFRFLFILPSEEDNFWL